MLPQPQASPLIAGSVLPIKKAEELLQTLPAVMAVRIIASETGAVDEIHVLTTSEATPKQTVRNIESALIAAAGSGTGVLAATLTLNTLVGLSPADIPRLGSSSIDATVLTFAVICAVVTTLAVGLGPALRLSRPTLIEDLKTGSTGVVQRSGTTGTVGRPGSMGKRPVSNNSRGIKAKEAIVASSIPVAWNR